MEKDLRTPVDEAFTGSAISHAMIRPTANRGAGPDSLARPEGVGPWPIWLRSAKP
jgi:hypothetical protein